MTQIVLASQSSGRAAMLRAAGIAFEATAAHVDEEALTAGLVAAGQTARLAFNLDKAVFFDPASQLRIA